MMFQTTFFEFGIPTSACAFGAGHEHEPHITLKLQAPCSPEIPVELPDKSLSHTRSPFLTVNWARISAVQQVENKSDLSTPG
eukprot:1170361-Rhodomonas_salina.2